jgi:hypothetical protein
MSDNVTVPGVGIVASDKIAGVEYQRVKLVAGQNDSTEPISGDSANGLDVDVTRLPLPPGSATSALQDAIVSLLSAHLAFLQDIEQNTSSSLVTLADGGNVALGSRADAPWNLTGNASIVSILKAVATIIDAGIPLSSATLAALENITVGGTVEFGSASLAALESITAVGPLTNTELRSTPVPIADGDGSLTVDGTFWQETQPVSGPLTDAQLRASGVPVIGAPYQTKGVDRSGILTTGGVAQNAISALATRRYIYVENPFLKSDGTTLNPAFPIYINYTGSANIGAGSIRLDPGQWWENPAHFCPTGAISVIAATTGHAWTAKEA